MNQPHPVRNRTSSPPISQGDHEENDRDMFVESSERSDSQSQSSEDQEEDERNNNHEGLQGQHSNEILRSVPSGLDENLGMTFGDMEVLIG